MFYLCKLVTVFGSVSAISRISRIGFICRFSCAAMNWSYLYAFRLPTVVPQGRSTQKFALRTSKVPDDGRKGWQDLIHPLAKCSDSGSAGLLESMSQLQDARLSKCRPKDLQAHRQLSIDLATGYGNPRDPRQ